MKMILLTILFSIVACGREETADVDTELQGYVDNYLAAAPNSGFYETIESIKFGELPKGTSGRCFKEPGKYDNDLFENPKRRVVVIRKPKYEKIEVERTVYHELGHCVHGRRHSDDPKSIMYYKNEHSVEYLEKNLPSMLRKMFK